VARLRKKQKPRRSGAPLPLLVPCFLARTRPLLCPRRSIRRPERRTSEPVARVPVPARPALPPAYNRRRKATSSYAILLNTAYGARRHP
jgi:hypothetical protein